MVEIFELPVAHWEGPVPSDVQEQALQALEQGHVLLLPQLDFALGEDEARVISTAVDQTAKNISYDAARGLLRGSGADAAQQQVLRGLIERYARQSAAMLRALLPGYQSGLRQGRTSFRPAEIAGRTTSWRKDDTRLHVDSFPSTPTQGRRILRVFTNINPHGHGRHWRLGESFAEVAQRFVPSIPRPLPGAAVMFELLHITKTRRSAYDHYMLRLHDGMKADLRYQAEAAQTTHVFPPACTWIVYTDQASHAATRGQYALEQTYYLDVAAMGDPARAPLAVLQRLLGRELV